MVTQLQHELLRIRLGAKERVAREKKEKEAEEKMLKRADMVRARTKERAEKEVQREARPTKKSRRPMRKKSSFDSKRLTENIGVALGFQRKGSKEPTPQQIMRHRERMAKLQLQMQKQQRNARLNAPVHDPYRSGFEDSSNEAEMLLQRGNMDNTVSGFEGAPHRSAVSRGASFLSALGNFAMKMGRQATPQERQMIQQQVRNQPRRSLDDRGTNLMSSRNEFNVPNQPNLLSSAMNVDNPATNIFKEETQKSKKILGWQKTNLI